MLERKGEAEMGRGQHRARLFPRGGPVLRGPWSPCPVALGPHGAQVEPLVGESRGAAPEGLELESEFRPVWLCHSPGVGHAHRDPLPLSA